MVYWMTYLSRYGSDHLINPTHFNADVISMYDLDIKLAVLLILLGTLHMMYLLLARLFCRRKE